MADEYYQMQVRIFAAGQFCEIVPIFLITDPTSSDDWVVAAGLVNALDDGGPGVSWLSKLQACMSNQAYVSSIRAKRIAPTGGNTAVSAQLPTDFPGTVSSEINTQQIAQCINWVNGITSVRTSRTFIPATPESFSEGGRWTAAAAAATAAFIATHIPGISTPNGHFYPVIYDRVAKTGLTIFNAYLSRIIGTQRRRERPL